MSSEHDPFYLRSVGLIFPVLDKLYLVADISKNILKHHAHCPYNHSALVIPASMATNSLNLNTLMAAYATRTIQTTGMIA